MNNDILPFDVLVLQDEHLISSSDNHMYQFSENLYSGSFSLELDGNSLIYSTGDNNKRLLIIEPEHFQCSHGVSIIETESRHLIQKAVVLGNECYFLGEDSHLYQFNLTREGETGVFKAEKVLKLRNRKICDLRSGKNHVIALVEQFNLNTLRMDEKLDSFKSTFISNRCKKCREDQELRLSILQLEADRKASETELLLDEDEIDSLRTSMTFCRKQRLSSRRSSGVLVRPSSLSTLPDFSKSLMARERNALVGFTLDSTFSFLSMDTVYIEEKRQEYEKLAAAEETQMANFIDCSTKHISFPKPYELWVWGENNKGQIGLTKPEESKSPTHLMSMNDKTITEISSGDNHCTAVTTTGELYIWGCLEATELWRNQRQKLHPLKLGPEQFVFRCDSFGESSYFLVIGRDLKTSFYTWTNGKVRRISQPDKEKSLLNVYVRKKKVFIVQTKSTSVHQKLEFIFKTFQQLRLIKGLLEIFNSINNLFIHEFDHENVDKKEREVLQKLCDSVRKFYEALCCIQSVLLQERFNNHSSVESCKLFGREEFVIWFEDFVEKFCIDDAYRISSPTFTDELNNHISRLALEFNVDSSGTGSQLRNLVLASMRFFTFLHSKAKDSLAEIQNTRDKKFLTELIAVWKRKHIFLTRLITSTKKTKQDAWGHAKLAQYRLPGRFIIDEFRVIEQDTRIKSIIIEQPKLYLHKVVAIYIFHDIFVTEEIHGLKYFTKTCPLSLVWIEKINEKKILVITPEAQYVLEFFESSNFFILCCGSWSDILMEGNPVPATRQGHYEFGAECPREHLRFKSYTGSWRIGKLCGRGKLVDSRNGDTEEGMFEDDHLHGFGQMFKNSLLAGSQSTFYINQDEPDFQHKDFYRGIFENGQLNGLCHIRYANDICYDGFAKDGIPDGFGVMSLINETMIGQFKNGSLNGYGVVCTNKENVLGEFTEGKQHGRGVVINIDGTFMEGEWDQGKMKKGKILTSSLDGCFPLEYEGDTDVGENKYDIGKEGRLRVGKDIYLKGTFSGNIVKRDIKVVDAVFCPKIEVESSVNSMIYGKGGILSQWAVPVEFRWKIMFETFVRENIGFDAGDEIELVREVWNKIVRGMIRGKQLVQGDVSSGFCDALERIPQYDDYWGLHYFRNAAEYWRLAQDNEFHPLRRLMNGVVEVFTVSYSNISAHPLMYVHCVLEAKWLILEVYRILRMLFPNFPENPYESAPQDIERRVPSTFSSSDSSPEKSNRDKLEIPVPMPCSDFVAECFFSCCSPTLFTIFSLHNLEREEWYWSKAMYLNAHTDIKLLTHLDVDRDLWPIAINSKQTRDLDRPIIVTTARDKFYRKAVDSLQRLPSETNPSAKLRLLAETYTVMEQCIAEQTEMGDKHIFTADSLLPAFIYVVIRAQIRHLGSEILFLDDFSKEWRGEGAIGLLFTNLQSAYMYICNEKSLV